MAMNRPSTIDRYRGCMFGLAIGDALGAPIEFLYSLEEIRHRFGPNGVTDFAQWMSFRPGSFTDDTQMSLATAVGLVHAGRNAVNYTAEVHHQYLLWLRSMNADPSQRRAPGHTCLSALESGEIGAPQRPLNDSKGCGGVMRTAPAGLVFEPGVAFDRGVDFAAITHGHPAGFLSAGALSCIVSHLTRGDDLDLALGHAEHMLESSREFAETLAQLRQARSLAVNRRVDAVEAIKNLGGGWVGEEALAIAVYCTLKFRGDFDRTVLVAVNHPGDSDSTGSIAGAIAGADLGVGAIRQDWVERVEDSAKIARIALSLFKVFHDEEAAVLGDYPEASARG